MDESQELNGWDYFCLGFKKYNEIGRSTRSEFWFFTLFNSIFLIPFGLLFIVSTYQASITESKLWSAFFAFIAFLCFIYPFVSLFPAIGVARRRLHDTNKSGWWLVFPLLSPLLLWLLGGIFVFQEKDLWFRLIFDLTGGFWVLFSVVLFIFFCIQSDIGENDFGKMPSVSISSMQRSLQKADVLKEERVKAISMLDKLKFMQKLAELRDKGLITEEEFQKKKIELMQHL